MARRLPTKTEQQALTNALRSVARGDYVSDSEVKAYLADKNRTRQAK